MSDERRALVPVKPPKLDDADRIHDGQYDRATADEVIFRVSHGEFLAWIGRDSRMPSYPAMAQWVLDDVDGFRARYEGALALGHDYIAASTLEDAENFHIAEKRTLTHKPGKMTELKVETYDALEHRKFKVATKFKYLEKVSKRYAAAQQRLGNLDEHEAGGERIEISGGLPDGEP